MVFSLVHMVVRWLIGLVVVLSRGASPTRLSRSSCVMRRLCCAVRSRVAGTNRRTGSGSRCCPGLSLAPFRSMVFLVTPVTISRWYRRLVARKWTCAARVGQRRVRRSRS
jgi:hypothetical protein